MQDSRPRYTLFAEAERDSRQPHWRFALLSADGSTTLAACDTEYDADEDRLVLIALVRGLEALDQPSDVTVVTRNASVARGLTRGMADWRGSDWRWERHGRLAPVRDVELWRRIDSALRFHTIQCRRSSAGHTRPHALGATAAEAQPWPNLRVESPAMVIVRTPRSRRRVRIAPPRAMAS